VNQIIRTKRLALFAAALSVALLVLVPTALAGKGGGAGAGGGKKPGGGTGGSGSLSLVVLNSADGAAHYGGDVTFNVSTTVSSPYVEVDCSQNGALVYMASAGFFPAYLWGQGFTLASGAWTGGGASCAATLYSMNASGTSRTNLASITFQVAA
jgi:hypothetical protein